MRKFPWGKETDFENKITSGQKIHTLRRGKRWKIGMKIHLWMGNPRNKGSYRVGAGIEKMVESVETVYFNHKKEYPDKGYIIIIFDDNTTFSIHYDLAFSSYEFTNKRVLDFIKNDGFDSVEDFVKYFSEEGIIDYQLVCWTAEKYH